MTLEYTQTPDDVLFSGPKYKHVLELLTQYPVLTYPRFFSLNTGLTLNDLYEGMEVLVSKGYKVRRVDGKGIVFDFISMVIAKEQIQAQLAVDLYELIPNYNPYAIGYLASKKYTFLKNPLWPSSIQNLVLIELEDGSLDLMEFSESSLSFEVLAYCIDNPGHVITNLELYNLMCRLGINIEHYEYGAIYRWFDYCKQFYGMPFVSIKGRGWGLIDSSLPIEEQEQDVALRLSKKWERYLTEHIEHIPCTTIGKLAGYTFYFPNFTMGYLARQAYIVVKDPSGVIRVLNLNMQNTAKRMLELFVRNNGYVDKVIAANALKEEWWQTQINQEHQRSAYMNGPNSRHLKIADLTTQDGYEYAIKRLASFLESHGLPTIVALPEVGYAIQGYQVARDSHINKSVYRHLQKYVDSYRSDLGIDSGLLVENCIFDEFDLHFILCRIDTLNEHCNQQLFQPGLRKTHLAIFNRIVYINGSINNIRVVVELTETQAEALRVFRYKATQKLQGSKRDMDNYRKYFKSIEKVFIQNGFQLEQGTGVVEKGIATLPIPAYSEI